MTTLNTIIEEENTPDTEWEKEFDEQFPPFMGVGALFPIFKETPNRNWIIQFIERTVSSRDTYWKERVRKTVGKIEESARTQDTSYEYGEGTYEGMMHSIFILKDITNEDNLK